MPISLQQVAQAVHGRIVGDDVTITGIASVASARPGDVVFVEDDRSLRSAFASPAAAVIAGEFAGPKKPPKPLLIVSQPRLAFAQAARFFETAPAGPGSIHPTAVVSSSAKLAAHVTLGPGVVIEDGVEIGQATIVRAGSVIRTGVKVGRHCELHPNVTIYPNTRLGDRVIVHAGVVLGSDGFGYVRDGKTAHYHKFPQIGRLEIEDDVEIGANTTVDRGALDVTRIGRGTKIDNLVQIGHNCQIGENVVIAAQTGLSGSITVQNGAVIGGQVGVGEHATIGEGVLLGGQSGVLPKKILRGKGIAFWGTPAKPLRQHLKEAAVLSRLAKKS
ncbi:MAG TPA: UDP-3-O-(3-hydroxymyristoyl)glucosamine N-acyltransferase [Terriglobales bacterium]|jgi:UDP-3-O-[3-hydroxymyristoyl] glucosamine N-acyltransferase